VRYPPKKGGMDLPDDVLAEADWVIASVSLRPAGSPREQINRTEFWAR